MTRRKSAVSFAGLIQAWKRVKPDPGTEPSQPLGEGWHPFPARTAPGYKPAWRIHSPHGIGVVFECHSKRLAFFLAEVLNAYERETGRDAYEDLCR